MNLRLTDAARDFLLTQVHERNALTMSDSVMLGSNIKVERIQLKDGEVSTVNYEVKEKKMTRYPKRSGSPCRKGKT